MKSLSSVLSFAKRKTKSARRRELMVVCVCTGKVSLSDDYFNGE